MWLLLGFDGKVYEKLDYFSLYFADSSKETCEFSASEELGTSLVSFHLIDDLKYA